MAKKYSRRLVVDASVTRSAGPEHATHPQAKQCRDVLKTILGVCHRVVVSPMVLREWNVHMSGFAKRWRLQMEIRSKILRLDAASLDPIDDAVVEEIDNFNDRQAALKDVHLVEAALAADRVVI